jgi:hypothetical protein
VFSETNVSFFSFNNRVYTDKFGYTHLNTESSLELATHLHRQNNKAFIDENEINY